MLGISDGDQSGVTDAVHSSDWRYYHTFLDKSNMYDPWLIWKPNPQFEIRDVSGSARKFFNSIGYTGPEINSDKENHHIRIITLGDSNTLGPEQFDAQTGEEVSWPGYLRSLVGKDVDVLNGGVWGYSSFQVFRRFKNVIPLKPDLVIISPSMNDNHLVLTPDSSYSLINVEDDYTLLHVKLVQLLQAGYDAIVAVVNKNATASVPREPYTTYQQQLNDTIMVAKKNHIHLFFVTRPYCFFTLQSYIHQLATRLMEYNEFMRQKAQEENIPVLDFEKIYSGKCDLFSDPAHFNEEGYKDAANLVFKKLQKLQLIHN